MWCKAVVVYILSSFRHPSDVKEIVPSVAFSSLYSVPNSFISTTALGTL